MKNITIMTFLFSILILFFSSCNKDTIKQNKEATEYFPNSIGNYWEYEVYDSSQIRDHPNAPRQYNVKVSITGTNLLIDNKPAMIWKYEYPWGIEIKYYRLENDSIKVYDTVRAAGLAYLPYPNDLFINPFFEEQKWKSNLLWTDSFYVKKDVVQDFQNVFRIHRDYIGQQAYYHNDYWFSQKIGFVKFYKNEINQGIQTIELWQLKSYNLN